MHSKDPSTLTTSRHGGGSRQRQSPVSFLFVLIGLVILFGIVYGLLQSLQPTHIIAAQPSPGAPTAGPVPTPAPFVKLPLKALETYTENEVNRNSPPGQAARYARVLLVYFWIPCSRLDPVSQPTPWWSSNSTPVSLW
jgi:hypothetical protein